VKSRTYWLDLFTGTTWAEFKEAGAKISGFRESRWKTVQKIRPGDYLLCYLTGISRFISVLEVTAEPFHDDTPIWKDEVFPARLHVKPVVELTPETAVPIQALRDVLSIFKELGSPNAWTGHLRGSPTRWNSADGEAIVNALSDAEKNPTVRPVDKKKLERRPRALATSIGSVTIPEENADEEPVEVSPLEARSHTEIQALLLKLGADMGFDVWVARNDRGREYNGTPLSGFPRCRTVLPLQFDQATNRTIELLTRA
jgi:hypothetical protein